MPFRSEAQRRFFHAAASRGEIKRSKVREWERETPKGKKLPERVKQAAEDTPAKVPVLTGVRRKYKKRWLGRGFKETGREAFYRMKKSASFELGIEEGMVKVALGDSGQVHDREDSRRIMLKELMAIKDPAERRRYLADMAAANHRLAMKRPSSVRGAVAAQQGQ